MLKEETLVKIIKWMARICSIVMIAMFLLFFIGEGVVADYAILTNTEKLMLLFLPCLISVGAIVAWKYEVFGAALMTISVIGINVVSSVVKGKFIFDFWIFLFIAAMFLIVGFKKEKIKRVKKTK